MTAITWPLCWKCHEFRTADETLIISAAGFHVQMVHVGHNRAVSRRHPAETLWGPQGVNNT